MTGSKRTPRTFKIDADTAKNSSKAAEPAAKRTPRAIDDLNRIEMAQIDYFAVEHLNDAPPTPKPSKAGRFGARLLAIGFTSLGALVALALGLWVEQLVTDLFARNTILGQIAVVAAAIFALTVIVFVVREALALRRLRSVERMHARVNAALETGSDLEIKKITTALRHQLQTHPKTAAGRATLDAHAHDVMDAQDRYRFTESQLLAGLDRQATALVSNAAQRVSVVTAVSPRAIIDVGYVLYENVRLIRVIAEHYGGRTGTFGTIGLVRRVLAHLAVTGTIALGDSLVQQVLGHGVAARISARLGEGIVNGLLTARIGIAAMDVCRPVPFIALDRPKLSAIARGLRQRAEQKPSENDLQDQ